MKVTLRPSWIWDCPVCSKINLVNNLSMEEIEGQAGVCLEIPNEVICSACLIEVTVDHDNMSIAPYIIEDDEKDED